MASKKEKQANQAAAQERASDTQHN